MELNRHIDTAVQYCQIPVEDTLEQDLSTHFKTAADFIHKAVSNNGRVLVHCERGCSRSATFVISYLISMKGMSVAEAVEHVRQCRSVIAPNASFMLQLHNFEQHCKTAAV
ncbi:dual specificity protein phosphatase 1-A-like [Corticium candelabrum]|uniref:dual specificity protein phosphatase 1-A-like n=1 Tax=Corticium candelabrum TaxID=121492 RepID=UPI002E26D2E7|nr:dual specificity protein phosphatase 1-A-like [Corticium candelabrum]